MNYVLPVLFLKEKNRYVAYTPALDLSTSGKTIAEAKKNFIEASSIFLQEISRRGTLDEVLFSLGWQKKKKEWNPPVLVKQGSERVPVPVLV
ncbi:MAG: type II toxin-antitoxin system HicB family antitoxin [Patescibacteria group bacterium]